jgi:hypothetical protein
MVFTICDVGEASVAFDIYAEIEPAKQQFITNSKNNILFFYHSHHESVSQAGESLLSWGMLLFINLINRA